MIHPLKKIIYAFVFCELWIGVCAAFMVAWSFLLLGLDPELELMLFTGLATVGVYNWQQLMPLSQIGDSSQSVRWQWKERNRSWSWMILISALIGAAYFAVDLQRSTLFLLALVSPLALLYNLPIRLNSKQIGLREFPYLKLFLIAITWAIVSAFIPLLEAGVSSLPMVLLVTIERGLFILAITIPFDVRDLSVDDPLKRTLPQIMGISRSLGLAKNLLILAAALVAMTLSTYGMSWVVWLAVFLGYGLVYYLVSKSGKSKGELHYTGLIDGTMVLIPTIVWLAMLI